MWNVESLKLVTEATESTEIGSELSEVTAAKDLLQPQAVGQNLTHAST